MAVDDNPENLKLLEDMLRQHDYEVRSFPRGRLALAALDRETPDLVLLDIDMPEMNGFEVCEKLKSNRRHSAIPVIFLSALNAVEDKVRGFQSGAVDYISKPFQFDEVQARVETHIKLRRAQQAEHDLLEDARRCGSRALGTGAAYFADAGVAIPRGARHRGMDHRTNRDFRCVAVPTGGHLVPGRMHHAAGRRP